MMGPRPDDFDDGAAVAGIVLGLFLVLLVVAAAAASLFFFF